MAWNAKLLVLLYVAHTCLSLALTLTLSLALGHVTSSVPYFSDLGDKPLESTVFTQLFVINAALLMLTTQVRYVQLLRRLNKINASSQVLALNFVGTCVGHLAAAGLFVLACFQESNAFWVHHLTGLLLYLLGSLVYFLVQTAVSSKIAANSRDSALMKVRIILCVAMVIFFLSFEIGSLVALKLSGKSWEERKEWTRENGGWYFHIASASSEWLLLILFQLYVLTFYADFSNVVLMKTRIAVNLENESDGR